VIRRAALLGLGGLLAALAVAPSARAATAWTTALGLSRLDFTATQAGGAFDGQFRRFRADIVFDPADLAGSRFKVEIETGSADTQDEDRDAALSGKDFFAADRWPTATYEASRFAATGPGRYEARGRLTIRGVTHDVPVTFTFSPAADGRSAALTGGTTIRRLDFGVGQGEWQDTKWIGNDVRIRFELILKK
jgi:polyisoprenoid-binding protein YceI